MPFTLAHPAAVLPLMRQPLVGMALVCGAMAPDVSYFIRATPLEVTAQSWYEPFTNATTSHTVAGLPVSVALAFGAYLLLCSMARPATWLVSGRWDATAPSANPAPVVRAEGAGKRRSTGWAWIPVSLLIGVLTHLLWDSLCDAEGPLAGRFEAMRGAAFGGVTWIRLVQHGSTVVGLAALVYALWRRRAVVGGVPAVRRRVCWALGGFLAAGLSASIVAVILRFDRSTTSGVADDLENVVSLAMKSAGAAVAVAVIVATAVWWVVMPIQQRRATFARSTDADGNDPRPPGFGSDT